MDSIEIKINDKKELFNVDEITFYNKVNLVFGKNGTGKSTISEKIIDQIKNYDVYLFDGFKRVLNENDGLNAILLGEKNIETEKAVEKINAEIIILNKNLDEIRKNIQEPEDNTNNLWTKREKVTKDRDKKVKEIDQKLSKLAAEIKSNSLHVVEPTYNIKLLKNDIKDAKHLDKVEIDKFTRLVKTEEKYPTQISKIEVDLNS